MEDRKAIASGLSLSDIGTGAGCGMNCVAGGGRTWSRFSMGASWACDATGVIGETGGLGGECEAASNWSDDE